jgi:hypothetical protein
MQLQYDVFHSGNKRSVSPQKRFISRMRKPAFPDFFNPKRPTGQNQPGVLNPEDELKNSVLNQYVDLFNEGQLFGQSRA